MAISDDLRRDAAEILEQSGHPWKAIWGVDYDSILYENQMGKPRTLWLCRQRGTGRLKVRMAEGFEIEPPDDFRQVLAGA